MDEGDDRSTVREFPGTCSDSFRFYVTPIAMKEAAGRPRDGSTSAREAALRRMGDHLLGFLRSGLEDHDLGRQSKGTAGMMG